MNPLASVRKSCNAIIASGDLQHVTIDAKEVEKYATELLLQFKDHKKETSVFALGDGGAVDWDASGMHYCADVGSLGPRTVQFILVLDALNFCFWPSPGFEYDTLALALKQVYENDANAFSADNLANITEQTLLSWFSTTDGVGPTIPNVAERVDRLREVGSVLRSECDGLAANIVHRANHSAVALVRLMLMHFPGFRGI